MFIPNLFSKQTIPDNIPQELETKIREFARTKNKEEFLKKSFMYIVHKWGGNRINFLLRFPRLFQKDFSKVFRFKGYVHCTTMNFILRVMAVKSGLFKEDDIKLKFTNTWYVTIHQYISFKVSDTKTLILDPWNYQFGIDYGKYGSGFDSMKLKPVR